MAKNQMRSDLEEAYEVSRSSLRELMGSRWQRYKRKYPEARRLTIENLARLTAELTYIVQYMMKVEKTEDRAIIKKQSIEIVKRGLKIKEQSGLYTDKLTGLGTRNQFEEGRKKMTAESLEEQSFVAIMMDVNGLKVINDTHGHAVGDKYLAAFGSAVESSLGKADKAYRLGGDEFLVIPSISTEAASELLRNRGEQSLDKMTDSEMKIKASDVIASRIASRFQKTWKNEHGFAGGFSYGVAVSDEKEVQDSIAKKRELLKKEGRALTVRDVTDVIIDIADRRQYAYKAEQKRTGKYFASTPEKEKNS